MTVSTANAEIATILNDAPGRISGFLSGTREVSNRNLIAWTIGAILAGYLLGQAVPVIASSSDEYERGD